MAMYTAVIVEKGNPGTSGMSLLIDGACVPDLTSEVPVRLNFDRSFPPVGTAMIFRKDDILYANINVTAKLPPGSTLWPAVSVRYERRDFDRRKNICKKYTVDGISLCITPNSDATIEPIIIL